MNIIILISCGFLLLLFILAFRGRHTKGVEHLLKQNTNVPPLFMERSAQIKYDTLFKAFQTKPTALQALQNLQTDFLDQRINIDEYNQKLDEWMAGNC
jgi:hypothetical protein